MTRSERPLDAIANLYETSLREHGEAPRGIGWRDPESHRLRFEKLLEVLRGDPGPYEVADLGCGYGALHEELSRIGAPVAAYAGYDISEEMVARARARVAAGNAVFHRSAAILAPADYVFASGIFNVRLDCTEDEWTRHVFATLDDMNANARRGFAFNMPTSHVDWRAENLYYGDPALFFDRCRREYSRRVALFHDYPLWEWTIVVRK